MKFNFLLGLILLCVTSVQAKEIDAYQKEYLFLKNQLEILESRKAKTISELTQIKNTLTKEVFDLNKDLSQLNAKNENLKTKLLSFNEDRLDAESNLKKYEAIYSQMQDFGQKNNLQENELENLNLQILGYLKKGKDSYYNQANVYDLKGKKNKGDVLNFGHILFFYKDGSKHIPLVKNQNGDYLFTPYRVDNLGKESLTQFVLPEKSSSPSLSFVGVVKEKLDAGGAIGLVILFLGFLGLIVFYLRLSIIKSFYSYDENEIEKIVSQIQNGNMTEAKEIIRKNKFNPLTEFIDFLLANKNKDDEAYESMVLNRITKVQSQVSKYGPYLIVLAAVAPLGLLGTVTGMIGTFDMITIYGTGNPKLLSGGIKEALVTTQMGLVVAIPAILAGNYLSSKSSRVVSKYEEVASAIPRL